MGFSKRMWVALGLLGLFTLVLGGAFVITSGLVVDRQSAWIVLLLAIPATLGCGYFIHRLVRGLSAKLSNGVEQLNQSVLQIVTAADQVASSSQTLAQGASEQAATLEETSSSGQEINAMTQGSAENSRSAATLMREVDLRVAKANEALGLLVSSMGNISESSERIAGIIKVIDQIAFQTNILALNAAVEAARAGEAGMGFAVVADEVRSLAQRCADAAKDTTNLIKESVDNAQDGRRRLSEVTALIQDITASSSTVKNLVDQVSQAGSEQARGINQISGALHQLEQVTQRNAASAEESAAASEELRSQAAVMENVVSSLGNLLSRRAAHLELEPVVASAPARQSRILSAALSKPSGRAGGTVRTAAPKRAPASATSSRPTLDRSSFPLDDREFQNF